MKKYKVNLAISIVWLVLGIIEFINKNIIFTILFISISITFGSLSLYDKKRSL